MRLIVCSPGHQGRFGAFYYSFDKKIINGLIRAGHHLVHFSDRDIADDAFFNARMLGAPLANRRLKKLARDFHPHAIVLMHADVVTATTLRDLRHSNPGLRIANVDCDLIVGDRRKRILRYGDMVDMTFITSGGEPLAWLRGQGLRAGYCPNPTDRSIEVGDAIGTPKRYDLVYFAGARGAHERWQFIEDVKDRTPELRVEIFGKNKQRIYGQAYFDELCASVFSLNWSARNDIELYSSDRIGQLFGVGSCVCLPSRIGFQRFLDEDMAIFFDGAEDLALRLRALLASGEWQEVARKGRARYRELFEGERVADYIVKALFEESVDAFEWGAI